MELREHKNATRFLDAAEAFLQERESENALPLGLALRTRDGANPGDTGSRYFTVEDGEGVLGVATQTPEHAVVFSAMPAAAVSCIATELPRVLDPLVGCIGPVEVVDEVAESWRAAHDGVLNVHASLRLFELTELTPATPCAGHMRLATEDEFELCQHFAYRFLIDCNLPEATPGVLPKRVLSIEQRRLFLWEVDGKPVACACYSRPLREGVTIGLVYTPDELRGNGYASNVVSALTAGLLDGSLIQPTRKCVTLYTDLENPTSNSIYRKLGYQPIGDHRHYMFE